MRVYICIRVREKINIEAKARKRELDTIETKRDVVLVEYIYEG